MRAHAPGVLMRTTSAIADPKRGVTAGRAGGGELDMYYEIHAEGWPLVLLHGP